MVKPILSLCAKNGTSRSKCYSKNSTFTKFSVTLNIYIKNIENFCTEGISVELPTIFMLSTCTDVQNMVLLHPAIANYSKNSEIPNVLP